MRDVGEKRRRSYHTHIESYRTGTYIILKLADALMVVMDSRLVIRVENMVITSNLEVLGVDLNGTTSNSLWLILLADFTLFTSRCLIMSIL